VLHILLGAKFAFKTKTGSISLEQDYSTRKTHEEKRYELELLKAEGLV
jgi:hypothetical protein